MFWSGFDMNICSSNAGGNKEFLNHFQGYARFEIISVRALRRCVCVDCQFAKEIPETRHDNDPRGELETDSGEETRTLYKQSIPINHTRLVSLVDHIIRQSRAFS